MLRTKQTLVAQNSSFVIAVPKGVKEFVTLATGGANHAAADAELHASWDDGTTYTILDLFDLTDPAGATPAKLTGASKAGFARAPGATHIKVKRTDANVGDSVFVVAIPE
jgi:hypothetical protein